MEIYNKKRLEEKYKISKSSIHWNTNAFDVFLDNIDDTIELVEFGSGDYSGNFYEHVMLTNILEKLSDELDGTRYLYVTLQYDGKLLIVDKKLLTELLEIDDAEYTNNDEFIDLIYDIYSDEYFAREYEVKHKEYRYFLSSHKISKKKLPFDDFEMNCNVVCNGMVDYSEETMLNLCKSKKYFDLV